MFQVVLKGLIRNPQRAENEVQFDHFIILFGSSLVTSNLIHFIIHYRITKQSEVNLHTANHYASFAGLKTIFIL